MTTYEKIDQVIEKAGEIGRWTLIICGMLLFLEWLCK
jgi:hypothetical protein